MADNMVHRAVESFAAHNPLTVEQRQRWLEVKSWLETIRRELDQVRVASRHGSCPDFAIEDIDAARSYVDTAIDQLDWELKGCPTE